MRSPLTAERREFLHQTSLRLRTVNRLLVLYATLLVGMFGVHKFVLGARREGWLYLALSWTSFTVLPALLDFAELLRQPAVGQGFAVRRLIARHPADCDVIESATRRRLVHCALVWTVLVAAVILASSYAQLL